MHHHLEERNRRDSHFLEVLRTAKALPISRLSHSHKRTSSPTASRAEYPPAPSRRIGTTRQPTAHYFPPPTAVVTPTRVLALPFYLHRVTLCSLPNLENSLKESIKWGYPLTTKPQGTSVLSSLCSRAVNSRSLCKSVRRSFPIKFFVEEKYRMCLAGSVECVCSKTTMHNEG